MWWDPLWLLFAGPGLLLALVAQAMVRSNYRKGLSVPNTYRLTGMQGAQEMLRATDLDLKLEVTRGQLTDHYDPRNNILRLSEGVANSPSVGALAITAHEMGHALQDKEAYLPMQLRSALVAPVSIGSQLGYLLFFAGFLLSSFMGLYDLGRLLSWLGVAGFGTAVLFALVTLPVELNASRRATALLSNTGLVSPQQMPIAQGVLRAAALTYVAALAQALGQLLYFVFLMSGRRRRD